MQIKPVSQAPTLIHPLMQRGITSKEAAEHWGKKRGVEVVYWLEKKEQVYAEKPLPQPAQQATFTAREGS